jgi:hypothetical protein
MKRFFKIVMKPDEDGKKETFFFAGIIREDGWFLGQRLKRSGELLTDQHEVLASYDYVDKAGIEHITHELIQPAAVETWTEYYEDLKYGGLTRNTIAKQKKDYGYV